MCQIEEAAFEQWAGKRLSQGSRGRSLYAHRTHMHKAWRESGAFRAWLPEHDSKCGGRIVGCGSDEEFGWPHVSEEAFMEARRADVHTRPCNAMCVCVAWAKPPAPDSECDQATMEARERLRAFWNQIGDLM